MRLKVTIEVEVEIQLEVDVAVEVAVEVEVLPTRLDQADARLGEVRHHLLEHAGGRHEVGVEDRDQLGVVLLEAVGERARLEPLAIRAADLRGVDALAAQLKIDVQQTREVLAQHG